MAVSTDGGATFTDYPVYINPDATVGYGHQFVNVSVDGRETSTRCTPTTITSTTHSRPTTARRGAARTGRDDSGTQIFPWSTAGDAGKIDVVYYQTPYFDGVNSPDNYPNSAVWTVGFAQNLNALKPGSGWARQTASPTVHFGGVCESGVTCTGNRDLYDDFGVAASPTTGLASIIYSDDQFDPNGPNTSGCDTSTNNSGTCDHTAIATQTSGTGIFTVKKK